MYAAQQDFLASRTTREKEIEFFQDNFAVTKFFLSSEGRKSDFRLIFWFLLSLVLLHYVFCFSKKISSLSIFISIGSFLIEDSVLELCISQVKMLLCFEQIVLTKMI